MSSERIIWKLSIAVGSFAITAAMLIGIGQGSFKIPLLVTACVVSSWIYTDWLGWVRLHRYFVYVLMISGSAVAIFDYLNQSSHEQLYSVANLLVYAQLPLLYQAKSRRIFEQIGIFLLLELVVAALVNDNVLYGALLIPTLTIGGWVLVLHCTFVSDSVAGVEAIQNLTWSGKLKKFLGIHGPRESSLKLPIQRIEESTLQESPKWTRVGFPLSIGFVLFASIYFYAMPRLSQGAYGATGFGAASVGFSKEVLLEQMGRMLKNRSPVLRLQLTNAKTGAIYRPIEPPYIRGTSLANYHYDGGPGMWSQGQYSSLVAQSSILPSVPDGELVSKNEFIRASISEQAYVGNQAFSIPPCFRANDAFDLQFDRDAWEFSSDRMSINGQPTRRNYEVLTQGFSNGVQSLWVPETETIFPDFVYEEQIVRAEPPYQELTDTQYEMLTKWSSSRFFGLVRYRDRVLGTQRKESQNVIDDALLLSDHLKASNEFSYTLDLSMKRDPLLDPIEDFVVNQKKGHCQYFAAALTMLLRSMDVPARLVVGYRPNDYNEVGRFFLVRQSHAHAWVEAYFTREQCEKSILVKLPEDFKHGAWYRLDPTPAGNGSNSGRQLSASNAQTLDFAQQLWRDYIMNIDRYNHPVSIESFGALSGSMDSKKWDEFKSMIERTYLQLQELIYESENWLSWQGVLLGMAIASALILVWRLILSLVVLMQRLRIIKPKRRSTQVSQDFYLRMVRLLEGADLKREPYQTHREFSTIAIQKLCESRGLAPGETSIEMLTEAYYAMRYGGRIEWPTSKWQEIHQALAKLESILKGASLNQG